MAAKSSLVFATLLLTIAPLQGEEAAKKVENRLLQEIKYLSVDERDGRGIGTEGLEESAQFIRDKFAEAGLDVTAAGGDAFQEFKIVTGAELGSSNRLTFSGPKGQTIDAEIEADFQTCSFGSSGSVEAPLVFCGYGIEAPKKDYNDFKGIDLEGKVAIIMRRTPQQGNPHRPFAAAHGRISRHAALRTKLNNAYSHGAAAVLFVTDPHTTRQNAEEAQKKVAEAEADVAATAEKFVAAEKDKQRKKLLKELQAAVERLQSRRKRAKQGDHDPLMKFGYGGHDKWADIPAFHIKQKLCNRLLEATLEKTLTEIETAIDKDFQPRSAALEGWTAEGKATVKRLRSEVRNVVGVLPGHGPHADETIVIGAHYDHLGMGGRGSRKPGVEKVHNGADDNASGTAALMELARRLGRNKEKLKRRIVFVAFTAEEMGLLGSSHYVKDPVVSLKKTIAMFNMDMIGRLRDDKLTVFGTKTAPQWEPALKRFGKQGGLKLVKKPGGFGPSDHSNFYGRKIPVLHFFTGTHPDYHTPADDWDTVNVQGVARVVDLVKNLVLATAQKSKPPQYVKVKGSSNPRQRGGDRPYFGSVPDFGTEKPGYALSGVAPDGPADEAGLKGGDTIIKFGDYKIGDLNDFDLALRKYEPGDKVKTVVKRDGQKKTFFVELDEPR